MHNLKAGVLFEHTFLNEKFNLGLTDPTVNDPCIMQNIAGTFRRRWRSYLNDPSQCAGAGF